MFTKTSNFSEISKIFLLLNTPLIFRDSLFRGILALWNLHGNLNWKRKGWNLKNSDLPVGEIYSIGKYLDSYSKVQASVGLSQINKIKLNIENRIRISKFYSEKLKDVNNFILSPIINGSSYSHYTLRIKDRKKFERYMKRKGIQINKVFDYSLPHLPVYSKFVKKDEQFPNSLIAGKNNINLPTNPQLIFHKRHLDKIVKLVIDYDQILK